MALRDGVGWFGGRSCKLEMRLPQAPVMVVLVYRLVRGCCAACQARFALGAPRAEVRA